MCNDIEKDLKSDSLRIKNTIDFGKFSYELEEKREESLIRHSNYMVAIFSVFFVALYSLFNIISKNVNIHVHWLLIGALVITIILLIGMALAVTAQWRYKYETMLTINELYSYFIKDRDNYKIQEQYDYQWIKQIDKIHKIKKSNNDKRVNLIIGSIRMFFIAIVLLFLSIVIIIFLV
jgi:hypothetical protein